MPNAVANEPLVVSTVEGVGSYLDVPYSRLPEVEALFQTHDIFHWKSENIISWNGGPKTIVIHFGRRGDPVKIQAALDQLR
jgi:hypothetical protein